MLPTLEDDYSCISTPRGNEYPEDDATTALYEKIEFMIMVGCSTNCWGTHDSARKSGPFASCDYL